MDDKRVLTRSICADLVHLEWHEPAGEGAQKICQCTAVLEDISPLGACLQVEVQVPTDIEATIHQDGRGEQWSAHCSIKYCTFREIGYFVGIEFSDPEAWSRLHFKPEHVLEMSGPEHPQEP